MFIWRVQGQLGEDMAVFPIRDAWPLPDPPRSFGDRTRGGHNVVHCVDVMFRGKNLQMTPAHQPMFWKLYAFCLAIALTHHVESFLPTYYSSKDHREWENIHQIWANGMPALNSPHNQWPLTLYGYGSHNVPFYMEIRIRIVIQGPVFKFILKRWMCQKQHLFINKETQGLEQLFSKQRLQLPTRTN